MKIDAENLVVGRMASLVAKKALLGEDVEIINCDKAVISGSGKFLRSEWLRKMRMGTHRKGPFYYRQPERFVKRIIRGMLPHRQEKGALAFKRIRCFSGIPPGVKREDYKTIAGADVTKLRSTRYMYIKDVCKIIGGK
jgi:large subunit ribosomal protein L13